MSSQILVQVLTRGFGFSIPKFVVFMKNLDELAVAESDYDVLVCASLKSLIAAISQSLYP